PPPANRRIACNVPWQLHCYSTERVHLETLQSRDARLQIAEGPLRCVTGNLREIEVAYRGGAVASLRIEGEGPFQVQPPDCAAVVRASAGRVALESRGHICGHW